jgi:acetoin utilization deacetylase AcuC-like enzyme
MLEHRPRVFHPERPARLSAILDHLQRNGQLAACARGTVRPATDEELARVHDPAYLAELAKFEEEGGGQFEVDTYVYPGSITAARLAAGAAIEAVTQVVKGPDPQAVCLIRPPGHHARPKTAMGFCLYSTIAVAAAAARDQLGLNRVLIVDYDVHHGNGTQEIFYGDDRIGFLSVHRFPFYPGSGAAGETGSGKGLGFTRNVPLRYGVARKDYHAAFGSALADMAAKVRPELILLSAGFDAHVADPVGGLSLEVEDFETLTRTVLDVAKAHAQGRLVSLLEGGYDVEVLPLCVEAHLRALGVEPRPEPATGSPA